MKKHQAFPGRVNRPPKPKWLGAGCWVDSAGSCRRPTTPENGGGRRRPRPGPEASGQLDRNEPAPPPRPPGAAVAGLWGLPPFLENHETRRPTPLFFWKSTHQLCLQHRRRAASCWWCCRRCDLRRPRPTPSRFRLRAASSINCRSTQHPGQPVARSTGPRPSQLLVLVSLSRVGHAAGPKSAPQASENAVEKDPRPQAVFVLILLGLQIPASLGPWRSLFGTPRSAHPLVHVLKQGFSPESVHDGGQPASPLDLRFRTRGATRLSLAWRGGAWRHPKSYHPRILPNFWPRKRPTKPQRPWRIWTRTRRQRPHRGRRPRSTLACGWARRATGWRR